MSKVEINFKFDLGDVVVTRTGVEECMCDRRRVPLVSIVAERWSQECHGGTQRLYRLSGQQNTLGEPELLLASEFDFELAMVSAINEDDKLEELRSKARRARYEREDAYKKPSQQKEQHGDESKKAEVG